MSSRIPTGSYAATNGDRQVSWDFFPCKDLHCDLCHQHVTGVFKVWFPYRVDLGARHVKDGARLWWFCRTCGALVQPEWEAARALYALEQAG